MRPNRAAELAEVVEARCQRIADSGTHSAVHPVAAAARPFSAFWREQRSREPCAEIPAYGIPTLSQAVDRNTLRRSDPEGGGKPCHTTAELADRLIGRRPPPPPPPAQQQRRLPRANSAKPTVNRALQRPVPTATAACGRPRERCMSAGAARQRPLGVVPRNLPSVSAPGAGASARSDGSSTRSNGSSGSGVAPRARSFSGARGA